jgi:twinkle protein
MELSAEKISEMLAARADAVAAMLLPGGSLEGGREWVCGDVAGGPGKSLKVTLVGHYAGQWRDWSNDTDHGDLIDLWRIVRSISPAEAIKQAKEFLGIRDSVRAEIKKYAKAPPIESRPLTPQGQAHQFLTVKRKLKESTLARYRVEIDPKRKAIVFPSYSPADEIINRSYRTLGEKKEVWQDTGCAPSLFGWQAISEATFRGRKILLAEGQIDAMTWSQWGIDALSIPNGTGASWVEYEWENLAIFDTIYLAFDQDPAGKKITTTICERLGRHRCLLVAMPQKDANDCLLAGYGADDAKDWIENAAIPRINKLVTAKEMQGRMEAEIVEKPEPFTLAFLRNKWPDNGFWFRPGEVTVWAGYSGAGKSTMLNFLTGTLLAEEFRVMMASLELRAETIMSRLMRIFFGRNLTGDNVRSFCEQVSTNLVFADIVGSIGRKELMEMMWFSFRRYGVTHFIIDSLMRIRELEEDYPAQGEFLGELQDFAKETGAHIHLVAHLTKPKGDQKRASMYDVKGSSLLINNADNALLIVQNHEKILAKKKGKLTDAQEAMYDTEIIVEKQRDTGWVGSVRLEFNPQSLKFKKHGTI